MNNRNTALHLGAVAATAFRLGVPVASITVVPCNQALGFVSFSGDRAGAVVTLADLDKQLQVAVASFVGEEMFIGSRSTASSSDMQKAQRIAEKMVECGDNREPLDIVKAACAAVRGTLAANEHNVHRIADALVREGSLSAHAFQQVIGGA